MAWFCAMAISVRVILLAKAVWADAKDADLAEKVRTASIIVRKSRVDMEICCGGGADVLGSSDAIGAGGTGGAEDADDVGNGAVTAGAIDGAIWGSFVSSAGWSIEIPQLRHEVGGAEHGAEAATCQQ